MADYRFPRAPLIFVTDISAWLVPGAVILIQKSKTDNIKSKLFSHVNVTAITLSQALCQRLQYTSLRFTEVPAHYRDLPDGVIL